MNLLAILGLDIGGANLKAAHSSGKASQMAFDLWKDPAGLAKALDQLVRFFPPCELLAVTMTGELCDCFESKRQGVLQILEAVAEVAGQTPVLVWQTTGRFTDLAAARADPLPCAAANWLALAACAGRLGSALLIDIGSTTTDIIPLRDGVPVPHGRSDPDRLRHHELVYTGVLRTPVCSLLGTAGAAELFATMQDVYLVLGKLAEDASNLRTADGRPATQAAAHARLARMICADLETSTPTERLQLARLLEQRQAEAIRHALDQVAGELPPPLDAVVLAGCGEFLARQVLDLEPKLVVGRIISLAEEWGPVRSQAACAHALVLLASAGASVEA